MLYRVEDRIISIHNKFETINIYLKTSSKGNKKSKEIEQMVLCQVRDVSNLTKDVIDTFIANVAIYKRRNMHGRMFHSVDQAKLLRDIAGLKPPSKRYMKTTSNTTKKA
jgi:hypothetical protein